MTVASNMIGQFTSRFMEVAQSCEVVGPHQHFWITQEGGLVGGPNIQHPHRLLPFTPHLHTLLHHTSHHLPLHPHPLLVRDPYPHTLEWDRAQGTTRKHIEHIKIHLWTIRHPWAILSSQRLILVAPRTNLSAIDYNTHGTKPVTLQSRLGRFVASYFCSLSLSVSS